MPRIKITSLPKAKLGKSQVGGQCPMGSSWDSIQQKCVPTIQTGQQDNSLMWGNTPSITGGTATPPPAIAPAPPRGNVWGDTNRDITGKQIQYTPTNPYGTPPKIGDDQRKAVATSMGMKPDDRLTQDKPFMASPNNPMEVNQDNQPPAASSKPGLGKRLNNMFGKYIDNNFETKLGLLGAGANIYNNIKENKKYDKWLHQSMLPDNYMAVNTNMYKGDYDVNNGMLGDYGFKSKGVQANPYYAQQGYSEYGGLVKAADGMTIEGDKMVQPSFLPDLPPLFIAGSKQPSKQKTYAASSGDSGNIADVIAAKESGGNYQALPKKKDGTLASSAVGKYQFLWNQNKNWIGEVTGETTKTGFMNNPDAQEKAFKYWDQTVLTPNAIKIKEELGVDAPINNIKYAIHFAGPKGAYRYFATGEETTDAFGSNVAKYANMAPKKIRESIDQSQAQNIAALNQGIKETGGQNNNIMKIRIIGTPDKPQMAGGGQPPYSGQSNYGLYIGQRNLYKTMAKHPYEDVSKTVTEEKNPKSPYVLEAEGGETILRPDGTHMNITGKRHTQGGEKLTAEQAPEGSFIYSDTKKMVIKSPEILKEFGMSPRKQGYTPAEIAKKYDTNKYRAILSDPNTDNLQKNTSKRMLDVYEKKLAELAMVQEGMKGYPNGIPDVAKSLFPQEEQQSPPQEEQQEAPQQGPQEEMAEGPQGQEAPAQEMMEGQPPMERFGGQGLRKYQVAGPVPGMAQAMTSSSQQPAQPSVDPSFGMAPYYKAADEQVSIANKYPWFKPYIDPKTKAGTYSRTTGKPTFYDPSMGNQYQNVDYWAGEAAKNNVPVNNVGDLQNYIYGQLNTANPSAINEMWNQYGPTLKSNERNQQNFADTKAGRRTAFLLGQRPPAKIPPPGTPPPIVPPPIVPPSTIPGGGTEDNTGGDLRPGDFNGKGENIPSSWTQQDINNLGAAGMNLALAKRYNMQSRNVQPVLPEFIPQDWRGYAASLQSGMGTAAQQLGTYQPGTGTAANLSFLQGQTGEQLGKYISGVDEYNARGLSDMNEKRANILNQFGLYNAGKRDYDSEYRNIADSKWRAHLGHGWDRFIGATNQGITNSANIYNMNVSEDPDYYIDPRTGKMKFNNNEAYQRFMARNRGGFKDDSSELQNRIKLVQSLRNQGYTPDEMKLILQKNSTAYNPDASGGFDYNTYPGQQRGTAVGNYRSPINTRPSTGV